MYREESAHKKIGAIAGIFITLGIAAAILALTFVTAFIGFWLNLPWFQLTAYGIVILAGFWMVRRYMTDYVYVVGDGTLLLGRRIGKREKELATIPVRDIRKMGPYAEMVERIAGKKKRKYTFYKKNESYVLDCGDIVILFSPTQELKERLRKGED